MRLCQALRRGSAGSRRAGPGGFFTDFSWKNPEKSGKILENPEKSGKKTGKSKNKSGKFRKNLGKSGKISENPEKSRKIRKNPETSGENPGSQSKNIKKSKLFHLSSKSEKSKLF